MKLFKVKFLALVVLLILSQMSFSQQLDVDMLAENAFHFTLNEDGYFDEETRKKWDAWVNDHQYVGLAEVHNSAQLGSFTKAFLNLLAEKGFAHFAVEMGPNVATKLQKISKNYTLAKDSIKYYGRKYGKRRKPLFVFADKHQDAVFVSEASRLGYTLWGLDQEYLFSYGMHFDQLYEAENDKSEALNAAFNKAKNALRKTIFKRRTEGQSTHCWYLANEDIKQFFSLIKEEKSLKLIDDIKKSWEIYCQYTKGNSNQMRADYMKQNFEHYANIHGKDKSVFLKFGNVHLTHGVSPFGVNDLGKLITEKSEQNESGFLIVRHLIPYRNGRSNVGKPGWKTVDLFLSLGKKDAWTVVDLRTFRKQLDNGEITTNEKYEYEIRNYDLLLLSPDDTYPKPNY